MALNWDGFSDLPGSARDNFEYLCRAAILANYGQYGQFKALANQPGVEFHLKLEQSCALGAAGRWYGWQCRWYGLDAGKAIGATRRKKIREALQTTEKYLPDLTDWVLWTRHPLTEADQKWFYGLTTGMTLALRTAADLEPLLVGDAELLRACYFGDLILTPHWLDGNHDRSVATVRRRLGPVHQTVKVERRLRQVLGESTSWSELAEIAKDVKEGIVAAKATSGAAGRDPAATQAVSELVDGITERAGALRDQLARLHAAMAAGDLAAVRADLAVDLEGGQADRSALRRLRALGDKAVLAATNLAAYAADGRKVIGTLAGQTSARLVAVSAEAGAGKTQVAAVLTDKTSERPAGVLLHGRDLPVTGTLDDLARTVTVNGQPVPSFEALLAAVDSAGQRSKRRLPVVIDGLSEAEDPRRFKAQLAAAESQLPRWPQVLLVATVRGEFYDQTVPETVDARLEIDDFGADFGAALRKYFAYYKIDPGEAELPLELLRHPLLLRLTCEVANPDRTATVGVEKLPASLTALFDAYIDAAVDRISELSPASQPFYGGDIRAAIDKVGQLLWDDRSRSIDQAKLRLALGDQYRPWTHSLVFALEQDGILLAQPSRDGGQRQMAVVWDGLAGHVIASSLTAQPSASGLATWLNEPAQQQLLSADQPGRHTLASDITAALAGLLPRHHHAQLWKLVDEPFKIKALRDAADLEAAYIDAETVDALAARARELTGRSSLLPRLIATRQSAAHPLNALFLDRLLRPLAVADRDLWWTEWLRRNEQGIIDDLAWLTEKWRRQHERTASDFLRARWVAWTLTSTVRNLRDRATLALYWFGRGNPAELFTLAVNALTINDLYVPERLLAAAYGVAMAGQIPRAGFEAALRDYLTGLQAALVGTSAMSATAPTQHALIRYYATSTFVFAARFYPGAVPANIAVPPAPAAGPVPAPISETDARRDQLVGTVQMDFGNYTMGRLFPGRRNYDMGHAGLVEGHAHVYGTIWELGWRPDAFEVAEQQISSRRGRADRSSRTERYGKKYAWIGFQTFAGVLDDRGVGRIDPEELDIDPSFPERGRTASVSLSAWARPAPAPPLRWLRHGVVRVPDTLLAPAHLNEETGPWICVAGHIRQQHAATGRRVFGYLTGVLVNAEDSADLVAALNAATDPHRILDDLPIDIYTFNGEFGWHPRFAVPVDVTTVPELYQRNVACGSRDILVEILAHAYEWEDYHSEMNQAAPALATSRLFTERFDLRTVPQTFSQSTTDSKVATLSLSAPKGFEGELLYLRRDLLHEYADKRYLVVFSWGQRQLQPVWPQELSPAHIRALRDGAQIWREVRVVDLG